jgi:hypothetical protein
MKKAHILTNKSIRTKNVELTTEGAFRLQPGKSEGTIYLGGHAFPYTYQTNQFESLEPFGLHTDFPGIPRDIFANPDGTFRLEPSDEELRNLKPIIVPDTPIKGEGIIRYHPDGRVTHTKIRN